MTTDALANGTEPAQLTGMAGSGGPLRIDLQPDEVSAGLAQLVLVVLRLLHELLERQAVRRVDEGQLSASQIEALGTTLQRARQRLDELHEVLGVQARSDDRSETERSTK